MLIAGEKIDLDILSQLESKCNKYAHGCYAVNNEIDDISYEDAKYCIDKYFSHIDYTNEFHLIGGEPLLYSRIKEIIEFIGQRYRKQINSFCITTNGTIIPNKDILEASQKYNLKFVISNYQNSIPNLKNRYEELCNILKNSNIEYYLGNSDSNWIDYGFETVNYQIDEDVLRAVFQNTIHNAMRFVEKGCNIVLWQDLYLII
ncbi:MAG: 4Fe-4S cluster-binding domain-containing protein [Butyrivibrio sp.]|nr:4Fe-4S cluster-binding domain-containing protein [Butyrivibrio sp.]